jgi:MFS family permease
MNGLLVALAAAVAFGVGEAVGSNTVQTYAMDLAPEDRRGYFLGTWQATMNVGQLIGPLVVGALAVPLGIPVAFAVIGGVIIATGVATAFVGRETVA